MKATTTQAAPVIFTLATKIKGVAAGEYRITSAMLHTLWFRSTSTFREKEHGITLEAWRSAVDRGIIIPQLS